MHNRSYAWVAPFAVGAAAMYFLDPDRGRQRRALVRDKAIAATRQTRDGLDAFSCDVRNRVQGLTAELGGLFTSRAADDRVIEERARAALGRVCSHPSAITVFSSGGHLTVSGVILSAEHRAVVRAIGRVKGVVEVSDQLEVHDEAGTIPALQGKPMNAQTRRWVT